MKDGWLFWLFAFLFDVLSNIGNLNAEVLLQVEQFRQWRVYCLIPGVGKAIEELRTSANQLDHHLVRAYRMHPWELHSNVSESADSHEGIVKRISEAFEAKMIVVEAETVVGDDVSCIC